MRIRGPSAWTLELDGSIEVTVGCRDCGFSAVYERVPEQRVHTHLKKAKALFDAHDCTPCAQSDD